MKMRFRKPSLRKRIAARTSLKRYVRHNLGLKAPRGWGWLTNPKKALYNRVYYRTTVGVEDIARAAGFSPRAGKMGCSRALLCVFLPPLAVLDKGCGPVLVVTTLTLLGWIPGVIAALSLIKRAPKRGKRVLRSN